MNLVCESCGYKVGIDDTDDVCCLQCSGKLIASSVLRARELATEDAIDQLWLAYYAVKRGDAEIQATYSEGCLTKHQAA